MFLSPWRTQFGVLCLLYSYPALLSQPIAIYWAPGIYKTWCWSLRQSHSFPGQLWTMPTNSAQCLEPWQKFPAVPVWGPWVGPAGEAKERSCGAGICLQAFPLTHRRVRGGRVGSSLPSTSRNQGRLDSQAQFLLAADLGLSPAFIPSQRMASWWTWWFSGQRQVLGVTRVPKLRADLSVMLERHRGLTPWTWACGRQQRCEGAQCVFSVH